MVAVIVFDKKAFKKNVVWNFRVCTCGDIDYTCTKEFTYFYIHSFMYIFKVKIYIYFPIVSGDYIRLLRNVYRRQRRAELLARLLRGLRGHLGPLGTVMQVEAPLRLQRLPRGVSVQTKAVVDPEGRPAHTSLLPLAHLRSPEGAPTSLVLAQPHTGRTHQVRCHLGHLGHPLLGDALYGSSVEAPWHLHCAALSFREPLRLAEPPWRTVAAPWPPWAAGAEGGSGSKTAPTSHFSSQNRRAMRYEVGPGVARTGADRDHMWDGFCRFSHGFLLRLAKHVEDVS